MSISIFGAFFGKPSGMEAKPLVFVEVSLKGTSKNLV